MSYITEQYISHSKTPRYQDFLNPPYSVQFIGDDRNPVDFTGVDVSDAFTFVLENVTVDSNGNAAPEFGQITVGTGDWLAVDASKGKFNYWFGLDDLNAVGDYLVWITGKVPGESSPRANDAKKLTILTWDGVTVMTTQIDLTKVAGLAIGSDHPVPVSGPVTMVDGASVTVGAKADASYAGGGGSASLVSLLRGIFDQIKITATQRALIAPWGTNPAQTAAAAADTEYKFGASGTTPVYSILMYNGSGADVRYKIDAASSAASFILADKQTVYIDVGAPILILHLSTAAQQYVNHATSAGIVFQAWG